MELHPAMSVDFESVHIPGNPATEKWRKTADYFKKSQKSAKSAPFAVLCVTTPPSGRGEQVLWREGLVLVKPRCLSPFDEWRLADKPAADMDGLNIRCITGI
jgi:hypothetical protein